MRNMFMAVGLGLLASFIATAVEAQTTCTESTLTGFDYQVLECGGL